MSLHIHSSINKECRGFQYLGWWHGLQWGVRGQLTLHSAVPGYSNHFIHHYFLNWTLWEYHGYLRSIQIAGHANFDKFLFGKLGLFGQFGFTYRSNWGTGTIGFCLQIYNYIRSCRKRNDLPHTVCRIYLLGTKYHSGCHWEVYWDLSSTESQNTLLT